MELSVTKRSLLTCGVNPPSGPRVACGAAVRRADHDVSLGSTARIDSKPKRARVQNLNTLTLTLLG